MTDAELDAIEAQARAVLGSFEPGSELYLRRLVRDEFAQVVADLRAARKRLAAIEALAEKWLKEAVDRNDECSPTIAAFTHDIQQAVRGDD